MNLEKSAMPSHWYGKVYFKTSTLVDFYFLRLSNHMIDKLLGDFGLVKLVQNLTTQFV